MCSLNSVILLLSVHFILLSAKQMAKAESKFRILAPEFICPKDEEAVVEKPDNTIITLKTAADADLRIEWTVRWSPLSAPAQRFTLMLWKAVRALEKQLNKAPLEPNVYVIENSELLRGVNYIFNISSIEPNGEVSEPKSFNIDNTQGDQKLMIEGRNDKLSVVLVGAQVALVDVTYVVEAQITTCHPTQDYYVKLQFSWTVQSLKSDDLVNVSQIKGYRLEVPPYTLRVGLVYSVTCQVMRLNSQDLITLTSLPFIVQYRGLEVYLNVDYLLISMDQPFTIESSVILHDYYDSPIQYKWECTYESEDCSANIVPDNGIITFPAGLSQLGKYYIQLTISYAEKTSTANATLKAVEPVLPVIQISPLSKKLNEGSVASVVANATNLAPMCTLVWYFATEEYLESLNEVTSNDTCDDCEHGETLSEIVTIYSLEEQFLSELADYTNETEWRQVTASFPATAGRARFVAQCGCSLTFSCSTLGSVYAEIWFDLNRSPKPKDIMISPESGTALETEFRISTRAVRDADTPLRYSFYCRVGDHSILLASYVEHRAVDTLLPYSEAGTEVWVQVCDALGACAQGAPKALALSPGESRTLDALALDARAHARRCEMIPLNRVAQSAVITYKNAGQSEGLTKFSDSLQISLSSMDKDCIIKYYDQYSKLLYWLAKEGIETSHLPYSS